MATPALLHETDKPPKPKKKPAPDRYWLHFLLLVVTVISTMTLGMRYMVNFQAGKYPLTNDQDIFPYDWALQNVRHLWLGLPFSLTLLGILLAHEFGHYFACKWHGIKASLPFMLPAPSLSGTAGAVIQLRSRVKTRAALLSIGAFGPISGFVLAIITTIWGLIISTPLPHEPVRLVHFQQPLFFHLLTWLLKHVAHIDRTGPMIWHPMLLASWIGLLITSLNLVPAGQLDGGHILYSFSPKTHAFLTYIVLAILIFLGVTQWLGWLLWTGLLLLPGMRHPKVTDTTPLTPRLILLGPICLCISILCTNPQPFTEHSLIDTVHKFQQGAFSEKTAPKPQPTAKH